MNGNMSESDENIFKEGYSFVEVHTKIGNCFSKYHFSKKW